MPNLNVEIDDETLRRLQRRSERHGRSLNEEMSEILTRALGDEEPLRESHVVDRIRSRFHHHAFDADAPERVEVRVPSLAEPK